MVDIVKNDSKKFDCSIAATLDAIGDRWTLLILRDLFKGVRRFEDIQKDLGIARNLLSNRLSKLISHSIVIRVPYQERPTRYEYRLTSKGLDLSPSLVALMHWGDTWCITDGPPTVLVHQECNTPLEHSVNCPSCSETVPAKSIRSQVGPGGR